MGYGTKIYQMAAAELRQSKARAEQIAEQRQDEFYRRCPRALEIKHELASNSARAARAVLTGGNVKETMERLRDRGLALRREFAELLTENGLAEKDILPQYACERCKDTGFVDGKMCACLKECQRRLAYQRLSMQTPLAKSTFETFSLSYYRDDARAYRQMEQVLSVCQQYAQRFRANSSSLLFKGGNGLGKTHLALSIANAALEKGFGVIYGAAQNFAVSLEKERFDSVDEENNSHTNSQLLSCDLLILDDLGTEFSSAYVASALYNVVDTRIMTEKPTIITTNLSMRDMESRYGERFVSRINGYYGKLEFLGMDVRNQKRRQSSEK